MMHVCEDIDRCIVMHYKKRYTSQQRYNPEDRLREMASTKVVAGQLIICMLAFVSFRGGQWIPLGATICIFFYGRNLWSMIHTNEEGLLSQNAVVRRSWILGMYVLCVCGACIYAIYAYTVADFTFTLLGWVIMPAIGCFIIGGVYSSLISPQYMCAARLQMLQEKQ